MSDPILLGISGALRKDATNRLLIREAARLFGAARYVEGDLNLPLYDGDLEDAAGIPDAVQMLTDQIASADAVVISTPEYNKGLSGVLKNALDWVSRTSTRPWLDKPVAIMSAAAGRSGGERGQSTLRALMVPFQPRILQGPELHLAASRQAFDENGCLANARTAATLQTLMQKLRAEIGR